MRTDRKSTQITKACVELERELELERRKASSLQDSLKDREKEYQKLKVCVRPLFGSPVF